MEFNEAELYYLQALLKRDFEELGEMLDANIAIGASDSILECLTEFQVLNLKLKSMFSLQIEKIQEDFANDD
ncbi:hypothetical protein [Enterococcus phage vB_OCPT_SDS2]|nr:hypothetical protein [Enterococcus phage vB_OCPT_SDS2]